MRHWSDECGVEGRPQRIVGARAEAPHSSLTHVDYCLFNSTSRGDSLEEVKGSLPVWGLSVSRKHARL